MSKLHAWSLSRIQTYEACPQKYHRTNILKETPKTDNKYLQWGRYVHDKFEARLKYHTPLPEDLVQYEPLLATVLQKEKVIVEKQYAISPTWDGVSWMDRQVWLRAKNDVTCIKNNNAVTLDWKTGKDRDPDYRQLMILAVLLFLSDEQIDNVNGQFYYLKNNKIKGQTYTRSRMQEYTQQMINMQTPLQQAVATDTWDYTPSKFSCGFCPASQYNGGKCTRAVR